MILLFGLASTVSGWGTDGHEAIGMTAMSALAGKALYQARKLLGEDVQDVGGWAHKVDDKYTWAPALHYQPVLNGDSTKCQDIQIDPNCPGNTCIIPSVRHFYGKVNDTMTVTIDSIPSDLTDSDMLKFMINLIADMHQPFHVASPARKNRMVEFKGKAMTLFEFWDQKLTTYFRNREPGYWDGGWTHVNNVQSDYTKDTRAWNSFKGDKTEKMMMQWGLETAKLACQIEMMLPAKKGDAATPIDSGVLRQWTEMMQKQILLAGARTAIVLNSLLHNTIKHKVEKGSAVKVETEQIPDFDDEEQFDTHSRPKKVGANWWQNLLINLGLLCVVLIGFYFLIVKPTAPLRSIGQCKDF